MEPSERIKRLANVSVEIDPNIPPKRYYRSGSQLLRMADIYQKENQLENAFTLYIKFLSLFVEKIPTHPQFKSVEPEMKNKTMENVREVMNKAETVKVRLLQRYKEEYKIFLEKQKQEEEKKRQEEEKRKQKQLVVVRKEEERKKEFEDKTEEKEKENEEKRKIELPAPPTPSAPPVPASTSPSSVPPSFDRTTKPLLSRIGGLRQVVIPESLMERFLQRVATNTAQGVESCGVLAGKLDHDTLQISHVIIPKQVGSADSCTTTNEEQVFDVQDREELLTVGWIHTHPTQTAFLSSVDLHTHCSYQTMMPEAVAVVCAPKYNETGYFTLTEYGLPFIAACRQQGFHPHPNHPPLFQNASHTVISSTLNITIIDLRK